MGSLGMLFYIIECFTVNLENLAADAVRRAQVRNRLAKLGSLIPDSLLEVSKGTGGLFGCSWDASAQHIELDLNAEEGLENAVVKVAGDAAPFSLDGPRS